MKRPDRGIFAWRADFNRRVRPAAVVRRFFPAFFVLTLLANGVIGAAKEKIRFTLVQIDNRAWLSLANLKRVHGDLVVKFDADERQGELRYRKRIMLFRLGEAQYQSQSEVHELDAEGVIEGRPDAIRGSVDRGASMHDANGIYFSREFVEEILTELALPVSYRFQKNNLLIVREKQREGALKLDFIFIDAGHGGKDSGALGFFDIAEKDITLSLARELKEKLSADFPQVEVSLTRSTDKFLRLEKRSEIANRRLVARATDGHKNQPGKFGVFVSIHCNSTLSPRVRGFEIYYLAQNPDNKKMRELQLRENQSFEQSGYIRRLKAQLMNAQIQRESKTLARQVFKGLANHLDGMIKSRKVKKADFAVLRGSLMPAILIETGYLTNKDDLKKLKSDEYRKEFAVGVSRGIGMFLDELAKSEK